ncbi:MAG: zinc ribbon domain-containing protein [Lachnospiraceae bacterium]|nr:zinc ribbon domain-containing protein [Lachnospiraceae bacterium]
MICKNCGAEMPDDAQFCKKCGSKVSSGNVSATAGDAGEKTVTEPDSVGRTEEPVPEEAVKTEEPGMDPVGTTEEPAEEAVAAEESVTEMPVTEESGKTAEQTTAAQTTAVNPQTANTEVAQKTQYQGKKKSKLPLVIGLVAGGFVAVIALIVVVVVAVVLISGGVGKGKGRTSKVAAYVSDDTLYVIKDTTKKNPDALEVCELDLGSDVSGEYGVPGSLVAWSDDEKYLYFFSELDNNYEGTLCRVQVSKLGKDENKNEKLVEEIDDGIATWNVTYLPNNDVLYITQKGRLYYYNGKKSEEIAKDVSGVVLAEDDDKTAIYTSDEDTEGNFTINHLDLSTLKTNEIDDGVNCISGVMANAVYYRKPVNDTDAGLYVCDYNGGSPEEISDHLDSEAVYSADGFYYTETLGNSVSLYDFIDDPYAADDAAVEEPVYPTQEDAFRQVDYTRAFSERYEELATGGKYSGRVDFIMDYCYRTMIGDNYYYTLYNEDDGNYYYYDASEDIFYLYDAETYEELKDAYDDGMEEWYAVSDRKSLRDALKDYEVDLSTVSLNYYRNGKSEVLVPECQAVVFPWHEGSEVIAFYQEADTSSVEKISIDDIDYAYEAADELGLGYGGYSSYGELYYAIGEDAGQDLGVEGCLSDWAVSFKDGKAAVQVKTKNNRDEEQEEAYLFTIDGSKLVQDAGFDDEAEGIAAMTADKVYYLKNRNESDETVDIFVYDGKDCEKYMKDVSLYSYGVIFDDGATLAFDSDSDAIIYNKKGEKEVKLGQTDDAINYISIKNITYMSDGKLYHYNGKDSNKIASKVDHVWFNGIMNGLYLNMW